MHNIQDHTPRVDCHRHLGGSITSDFVWEAIKERNYRWLAEKPEDVIAQMTFADDEPRDFHRFLNKFKLLDDIEWDEGLIDRSVAAACRGLARESVDFAWMRFSINKYMDSPKLKWHRYQAVDFIHGCFQHHAPGKVGLLLSLKMESPRASQRQYAELIDDACVAERLMGIDLVGDEGYFDADFYEPIFKNWKSAGKVLCAHVGESQSPENVLAAITRMGVTNVAHGFKIHDRPDIMREAKGRGVCFDMALTSNYLTGTWKDPDRHPIRAMHDFGLDVTVGTDDPVQCSTTYDGEFKLLRRLGFTPEEAAAVQLTAANRTRALGLIG